MWPRTDEERNRGYLTGFVAFMTRRDADRAAAFLKGMIDFRFLIRSIIDFW